MAALFLYRKLAKEPVEEHVLMAGPEVGATADEMKVGWLIPCKHIPCEHYGCSTWFSGASEWQSKRHLVSCIVHLPCWGMRLIVQCSGVECEVWVCARGGFRTSWPRKSMWLE